MYDYGDPLLARLRHVARMELGKVPRLYISLLKLRVNRRRKLVSRHSHLLLEGYFCSGNTFVQTAIEMANPDIRLAHHIHSPAHVQYANRLGVPTLVLFREPRAVTLSTILKYPYLKPQIVLREWVEYYRRVWPVRGGFLPVDFEQATKDLSSVIVRVNDRFGTRFAPYVRTQEADQRVLDTIATHHRQVWGKLSETVVPRPSDEKRAMKERLAPLLDAPRMQGRLRQATELYEQYREAANE